MLELNPGSICSILTIFFLSYYARENVYPILTKMYNDYNFFKLFTLLMSSQPISEDNTDQFKNDEVYCLEKEEPRYEDKFLNEIRKMNNEFIFDEKEQELERNKFDEFLLFEQKEYRKKVDDVNDQITSIEKQINEYERDSISDDDFCNVKYNENVVEENENKDAIKSIKGKRR